MNISHNYFSASLDWCVLVCIFPTMDSRSIIKLIEADGWREVRTAGSHHQFRHPTKPGTVTVPHPKKDLNIKTQNSILKQAGLK
jgi:predicted RNA binding protein YcfA (HicA-like mRNA interferase family)